MAVAGSARRRLRRRPCARCGFAGAVGRRGFARRSTRAQRLAGVRLVDRGDFFRRAGGDDPAARLAAFRPQVDDPVGRLDHVEIVLDDQHRVAGVDEVVQHLQQQLDVGEVQAGGRLVEQVERPAGALLDQFAGQLDPLGLAAGERGRRLAELHVVEPHVVQRLQLVADRAGCSRSGRSASWTSISSTSAIDLPLKRTCSVSRLKRWPSQTGQVTQTSARKSISSLFEPLPSQASHRPPATLKLNRPGL